MTVDSEVHKAIRADERISCALEHSGSVQVLPISYRSTRICVQGPLPLSPPPYLPLSVTNIRAVQCS
ncbi:hypothetical protein ACTXT7_017463, partial [Hymenolepis weldensis]